jgi:hypothetical protein
MTLASCGGAALVTGGHARARRAVSLAAAALPPWGLTGSNSEDTAIASAPEVASCAATARVPDSWANVPAGPTQSDRNA